VGSAAMRRAARKNESRRRVMERSSLGSVREPLYAMTGLRV
jgi:hypothetical protein